MVHQPEAYLVFGWPRSIAWSLINYATERTQRQDIRCASSCQVAPLPRDVLVNLRDAIGVPVVEHYGSTEAARIAANLLAPGRFMYGACGIPWPARC